MGLRRYQTMRDFSKTPEPKGRAGAARADGGRFVVQKHDATRLHYDFRLELDGVLKSWAVPKGPSLDPADKRLAVHVEDHPIDYGDFEGVIPEGEYGGGPVIVWDRGRWKPVGDARAGLRKGDFKFLLDGEKLKGRFVLVRMHTADGTDKNWLLMKEKDEHVRRGGPSVVERLPKSVKTGRGIEDLVEGKEPVWHSNKPPGPGAAAGTSRRRAAAAERAARAAPAAPALPAVAALPGARRGALPARFVPHPVRPAETVPEGDAWLHEIAFEGRRAVVRVVGGKARLLDASGKDLRSPAFASIVRAASALPVEALLLDGMLCFVDAQGKTSEAGLSEAVAQRDAGRLRYFAFDLIHLDGVDLRAVPLLPRKEALERLLGAERGALLFGRHHRGEGSRFLAAACERGLYGVVSKRADGLERPRGKQDWLETRCAPSTGLRAAEEETAEAPIAKPRARPARGRSAAGPAISNPDKVL